MYIQRIEIDGIRCYKRAALDFSRGINLLSGENNSGKSTIIHALHAIQSGMLGPDSVRFGDPHGSVKIHLTGPRGSQFYTPVKTFLDNHNAVEFVAQFVISADGSTNSANYFVGQATAPFTVFPSTQPGNLMVPYFSQRRAAEISEAVGAQATFTVGGNLEHLVPKVDRCLTSRQLRDSYRLACEQVFGFEVTTFPTNNGKMAGLEINAVLQQYISIRRLGAGIAQSLGLIVELLLAEDKIFLIEEIENDLHPTALRALLDLVVQSTEKGNQFIISTHSSVVVRTLGGAEGSKVWRTERVADSLPPESKIAELASDPTARHALLQSLGYDFGDFGLYDAWLIFEESSAERIVREFIIPWFAPGLAGRVRTLAAQGASDVEPRFLDLHRLFVFTHLEPAYFKKGLGSYRW